MPVSLPSRESRRDPAIDAIIEAANVVDLDTLGADINLRASTHYDALRGLGELLTAFNQMEVTPEAANDMLLSIGALIEQQADAANAIGLLCDAYITRVPSGGAR